MGLVGRQAKGREVLVGWLFDGMVVWGTLEYVVDVVRRNVCRKIDEKQDEALFPGVASMVCARCKIPEFEDRKTLQLYSRQKQRFRRTKLISISSHPTPPYHLISSVSARGTYHPVQFVSVPTAQASELIPFSFSFLPCVLYMSSSTFKNRRS